MITPPLLSTIRRGPTVSLEQLASPTLGTGSFLRAQSRPGPPLPPFTGGVQEVCSLQGSRPQLYRRIASLLGHQGSPTPMPSALGASVEA